MEHKKTKILFCSSLRCIVELRPAVVNTSQELGARLVPCTCLCSWVCRSVCVFVCLGALECGEHGDEGFSLRCGCISVFSLSIPAIPSGSHLTSGSSHLTFQLSMVLSEAGCTEMPCG